MTRMAGHDCAVMRNSINAHTHARGNGDGDVNGDRDGDVAGTGTGVEIRGRIIQDGNGDGSGDGNDNSSGYGNGDGDDGRRIMLKTRAQGREAWGRLGESEEEAKRRKNPHKRRRSNIENGGNFQGCVL